MKICCRKDCPFNNEKQSFENFNKNGRSKDKFSYRCKTCIQICYQKNKNKLIELQKRRYQKNKEKILKQTKDYYLLNQKIILQNKKEYYEQNKKEILFKQKLQSKTNESKQKRKIRINRRYQTDINFRLRINLRNRLHAAIKNNQKLGSAVDDLMLCVSDLKKYFEERFYPNPDTGEVMSWENYGWKNNKLGWDIDHIKPLSFFNLKDRKQFLEAVHYTNLQPKWAKQNRSEGARLAKVKDKLGDINEY